jgi:hypothetical protein
MANCDDVRKSALALEGVSEVDHWGRPSYRTAKRIFAVTRPDEKRVLLHLTEERKAFLFEAAPDVFVKFMWGKKANLLVHLPAISKKELAALLREAWENAQLAPRKTPARRKKA